jgi:guanylate kinase
MSTHKRIILVGPAAAGKTHIKNAFREKGFKTDVSYTSRPLRKGEIDGIDYHFIGNEFVYRVSLNQFYEYAQHGDYYYGTGLAEWNNSDVFIMETHGLSLISKEDRKDCLVVYVNTPFDTRLRRMRERGWEEDNIAHRTKMDADKFKDFKDFDLQIQS